MSALNYRAPILFYDGVCNLCNATVKWVLRNEKNKHIRFAALQSDFAKEKLNKFNIDLTTPNSLIFLENEKLYMRSDGAIQLAYNMGGIWKTAILLKIFPAFLRNGVYHLVAQYRYSFFGKTESCMLLHPDYRERFIS